MRNFILGVFLLGSTTMYAQDNKGKDANAQTAAPAPAAATPAAADTLPIRQLDGTILHIIGFGDIFINYTETVDGYTLVLNEIGIYEYAKAGKNGELMASGIPAHDPSNRSPKEIKKLKKIPLHLRYTGQKLENLQKKQRRFNVNPKYRYEIEKE